jgi:hypothetical protein
MAQALVHGKAMEREEVRLTSIKSPGRLFQAEEIAVTNWH